MTMKTLKILLVLGVLGVIGAALLVWSGKYHVGADEPHWPLTYAVLEFARERSIDTHSAGIEVPDLSDPELIRNGAGNYSAMCVSCHLSPGAEETELSAGLYPRPTRWDALGKLEPRKAFWTIKHGVKASGMPAWGLSMEDRYVWGMVAFMQQFSTLSEAEYRSQVAASGGHAHGGGETEVGGHDARGHQEPSEERSSFEPMEDDPMAVPSDDEDGHNSHDH
jgi:mono/diheme cytochrome c family protein